MLALSTLVRVTVTASPARATRQGVLFLRKVAMVVSANVPFSCGPTMTGSPSCTMPRVKTPPRTIPASGTLNISSTRNSGGCWCSSGGERAGGTAFRNLWRRLRFFPDTHDTVKIGATLHLQENTDRCLLCHSSNSLTSYWRILVQHCKHLTQC